MTLFPSENEETPCTVLCRACHRPLTTPESRARRHGEKCAKDRGLLPAGPRIVRLARVRAGGSVKGQEDLLAGET